MDNINFRKIPYALKVVLFITLVSVLMNSKQVLNTHVIDFEFLIYTAVDLLAVYAIFRRMKLVYWLLVITCFIPAWVYFITIAYGYTIFGYELLGNFLYSLVGILFAQCLVAESSYKYFYGMESIPPWKPRFWKRRRSKMGEKSEKIKIDIPKFKE